jgi:hypothetical protein
MRELLHPSSRLVLMSSCPQDLDLTRRAAFPGTTVLRTGNYMAREIQHCHMVVINAGSSYLHFCCAKSLVLARSRSIVSKHLQYWPAAAAYAVEAFTATLPQQSSPFLLLKMIPDSASEQIAHVAMLTSSVQETDEVHWHDDGRGTSNELALRPAGFQNGRSNTIRRTERLPESKENAAAGANGTMVLYRGNDCNRDASSATGPESQGERRDSAQTGSSDHWAEKSIAEPRMLLDEYKYVCRGTPSVIGPSMPSGQDECRYGWTLPRIVSLHCDSILELKLHREKHQAHILHAYGRERQKEVATYVLKCHEIRTTPKQLNQNALVLKMSKGGATPGEWRLLKLYNCAYSWNNGLALYESRGGIKGAESSFPGIGRKSPKQHWDHLHQDVVALHRNWRILPPLKAPSPRNRAKIPRCRRCRDRKLRCGNLASCEHCINARVTCIRQGSRDALRMGVLRRTQHDALSLHLDPPAL